MPVISKMFYPKEVKAPETSPSRSPSPINRSTNSSPDTPQQVTKLFNKNVKNKQTMHNNTPKGEDRSGMGGRHGQK